MKKWKDHAPLGRVPNSLDLPGRDVFGSVLREIAENDRQFSGWGAVITFGLILSYPLIGLGTVVYYGLYLPLAGWLS